MGEIQEKAEAEGLKATKYVLGDKETDGHTHIFYLRDDLPVATTADEMGIGPHVDAPHAHSITEGPENTLVCQPELDHTHTVLNIEEAGDYTPRTLHI